MKPDPVPLDVQARILDAAIRAPNVAEQWRFILVDDPEFISKIAPLYRQATEQLMDETGVDFDELLMSDTQLGLTARSAHHLAHHFEEVPLVLIAFARHRGGGGIYPAIWGAMLAARAEGIGSTLTGVLHSYKADEMFDLLGAPKDAGWYMHGVVPMGYPRGKWGVGARTPVHEVAARNSWDGDLGLTVPEPLWPR